MSDLDDLEIAVKNYGMQVLHKRYEKLIARKFVLFPYLRAKHLLRKIRILKG